MQENNFEKGVQQVMQEFTITPSDNLWSQVKADLEQKTTSKRKWWFAAMILCACLLLPSLYLHDLEISKGDFVSNNANANKIENSAVIPERVESGKKITETVTTKTNKSPETAAIEKIKTIESVSLTSEEKNREHLKQINKSIAHQQHSDQYKNIQQPKQVRSNKQADIAVTEAAIDDEQESVASALTPGTDLIKIPAEYIELIKLTSMGTVSAFAIQPVKLANEISYNLTSHAPRKNSSLKNKGSFEITAAAGRFSLSDNSLFGAVFSSDPAKSFATVADNINGGVAITDTVLFSQSSVKHGLSISLALNYLKPVSKKTAISFGAGFRYGDSRLISENYLAYPNPSTSNNFSSRSISSINTSNHFYFIDLPVQIQSLIGSGKKLPLYWNAGLQYSYLIHAVSTKYNAVQNSYSSSVLTKNIFGISAGLDVEFFKNRNAAFKIGPSFYYSFSKAANKDLYQNMHYHFAGLRIKKSL